MQNQAQVPGRIVSDGTHRTFFLQNAQLCQGIRNPMV
jgi:hypothetical protein